MCGGTSYGQASNPSVMWKKYDVFKIVNDDDDDQTVLQSLEEMSTETNSETAARVGLNKVMCYMD